MNPVVMPRKTATDVLPPGQHYVLQANPSKVQRLLHPEDGGPGPTITGMCTRLHSAAMIYRMRGGTVTLVLRDVEGWDGSNDSPWAFINEQYPGGES